MPPRFLDQNYFKNPFYKEEPKQDEKNQKNDNINTDSESDISSIRISPGVARAEITRKIWTKQNLIIAYSLIIFSSLIISFASYTGNTYEAYATSSFAKHSAITTANVIYKIARLASYPIIAKLSDVFGRSDGFSIAVVLLTVGYVMYAGCNNVATYCIGMIFEGIGDVAYTIMQQVFIADTTSLINRGFWASLPESLTTIPTLYLGSTVAESVLNHSSFRWGYGMWAIILPFTLFPLIIIMVYMERKAKKEGASRNVAIWKSLPDGTLLQKINHLLWVELDIIGGLLLVASLALILVPLSLTGKGKSHRWEHANFIAMFVLGFVFLIFFLVWIFRFAKNPFIPFKLMKNNKTVIAACFIGFFDFLNYATFTSFFPSYLQVAGHYSSGAATRIDNSLRVSFQIGSLVVGILMRFTKKARIYVYIGVPMVVLGQGLMIYLVNKPDGTTGNEASFIAVKTIFGVGRGFYQTSSQVIIQSIVTRDQVAISTAVFLATMTIGGSFGSSICGAVWSNYLPDKLEKYLPDEYQRNATAIFNSIKSAMMFKVGTEARAAIDQSYKETARLLAIMATCFTVPMIFLLFFIASVDLVKEDEIRQREVDRELEKSEIRQNEIDNQNEIDKNNNLKASQKSLDSNSHSESNELNRKN
ncbi:MFS general substrate transporter [Ascoidea rubescens DSM 1968]|uniref:MFS general substrate transporter n=1 Tax=Ascoidea rubescens DSM 1968 TaxID=1344418 RepID=A0A1D2VF71_9ASCO|nr:MFS general substrate transporter [Ascoidea rubescens DSM 1968]ODV60170.1 MFS general substrate transporter [Ascoidea rubescens DSM 1968]